LMSRCYDSELQQHLIQQQQQQPLARLQRWSSQWIATQQLGARLGVDAATAAVAAQVLLALRPPGRMPCDRPRHSWW
jgi:hypothetical protein